MGALLGHLELTLLNLTQLFSHFLRKHWHYLFALDLLHLSISLRIHELHGLLILSCRIFKRSTYTLPTH